MYKKIKAYLVKREGEKSVVVTNKKTIQGIDKDSIVETTLIISTQEIKEWHEEVELLGLDEEAM